MLAALGYDVARRADRRRPCRRRSGSTEPLALGRQSPDEAEALARSASWPTATSVVTADRLGYSDTLTPAVILRNVLENPAWYTAYTPYQPEISQGRLEALLNFQTMVADLTGMDLANASLLDEATAAAEAMAHGPPRSRKARPTAFLVDADCHPQTHRRGARPGPSRSASRSSSATRRARPGRRDECFGVLLRLPGLERGGAATTAPVVEAAHDAGRRRVRRRRPARPHPAHARPARWAPTSWSGSAQRFGVPLGLRRPARRLPRRPRRRPQRSLPGRLVGVSVDAEGRPALRLALQTREQHIRREKATCNICTAQVLLAVIAGLYAVYHGPDGLAAIAERVHRLTAALAAGLRGRRASSSAADSRSSTRSPCGCPAGPTRWWPPRSAAGINLRRGRRRHRRRRRSTRPPPRDGRRAGAGPRSAVTASASTTSTSTRRRRPARRPAPHRRRSSPTRSSTATTPRPRCCATCAASPTATSRSTAR